MKASDAASNEQMQHIIVIMLAKMDSLFSQDQSTLFRQLKTLSENKRTGVIISSSQLFYHALLPCPPFSPAWNGAGRYGQYSPGSGSTSADR